MVVLAVKIHKSLKRCLNEPDRQTVKECTRKYWKCSKLRRKEVEADKNLYIKKEQYLKDNQIPYE